MSYLVPLYLNPPYVSATIFPQGCCELAPTSAEIDQCRFLVTSMVMQYWTESWLGFSISHQWAQHYRGVSIDGEYVTAAGVNSVS